MIVRCPYCNSSDVQRIGLYEFYCESCAETFDAGETDVPDDEFDGVEDEDD